MLIFSNPIKPLSLFIACCLLVNAGLIASYSKPVQAHKGSPNTGAYKACAELSLGQACEWSDSHEARYLGSCRKVTSSLICVRNKPIVYAKDHQKKEQQKEQKSDGQ